jgi:hypothetical protein
MKAGKPKKKAAVPKKPKKRAVVPKKRKQRAKRATKLKRIASHRRKPSNWRPKASTAWDLVTDRARIDTFQTHAACVAAARKYNAGPDKSAHCVPSSS